MATIRNLLIPLIATILCTTVVDPSPVSALKEHTRDGWMVGFSLGAGPGKFKDARSGVESTSETGGIFGLRVGRMIHPLILLNAELDGWNRTTKASGLGQSVESAFTFFNLALAGTYYPADPTTPLGGLYLRGGIAASSVENEVTTNGIAVTVSEDG